MIASNVDPAAATRRRTADRIDIDLGLIADKFVLRGVRRIHLTKRTAPIAIGRSIRCAAIWNDASR
jgi:hypothetical protein